MAKVKLPAGPQDIAADWLTAALRENGVISGVTVTAFDYEAIGVGVGILGQLARFNLTYDAPEAGAPSSVIGKFPGRGAGNPRPVQLLPLLRARGSVLR